MESVQAATILTVSGAFVVGLVLALLGSIKLVLAKHLQMGERGVAGLFSALNLALLPSMLGSGMLIDRFGVRWVLLGGSVLTAAAVFMMSQQPNYRRAFGAILLTGLGSAAVSTACIVLMPLAFFNPPDTNLVLKVNLGHVFIALGALLTPALTDVLFRTLRFSRTIAFLSVLCLVPALLCLVPTLGQHLPPPSQQGTGVIVATLNEHIVSIVLAGLLFFFYAPLEGTVSVWTTTYLTEMGDGQSKAAWVLTGFWTAFLASRGLAAYLLSLDDRHNWSPWLLVVFALVTAVLIGNQAGTANRFRSRFGLLFVGFFLGPIFPTLLGMLLERVGPHTRGTTYGLLFSFGSFGSLLLAPIVARRVGQDSAQQAFRIPLVLALATTLAALGFVLSSR